MHSERMCSSGCVWCSKVEGSDALRHRVVNREQAAAAAVTALRCVCAVYLSDGLRVVNVADSVNVATGGKDAHPRVLTCGLACAPLAP